MKNRISSVLVILLASVLMTSSSCAAFKHSKCDRCPEWTSVEQDQSMTEQCSIEESLQENL